MKNFYNAKWEEQESSFSWKNTNSANEMPRKKITSSITTSEDWRNLVNYLRECLIQENQQQFIIEKPHILKRIPNQIRSQWMSVYNENKTLSIPIVKTYASSRKEEDSPLHLYQYINENFERNKRLCLGKFFLVLAENRIAPLLYVPLQIERKEENNSGSKGNSIIEIKPEGVEISYAALKELKLNDEEISAFLEEIEESGVKDGALEQVVLERVSKILNNNLEIFDYKIVPNTIYDCLSVFAVSDSIVTINLILELSDLAKSTSSFVPENLKYLLNTVPEHTLQSTQDVQQDDFFVTPLYPAQVKALHASRIEPVLVVTGPPGTGKSQLVINLLVDAFLRGKRVLFASRNNQAIDVVMNRLAGKLNFPGVVRVGNREKLKEAVRHMRTVLSMVGKEGNQISREQEIKTLKYKCYDCLEKIREYEENLRKVRDLKGKLESYQKERAFYLEKLPHSIASKFESPALLPKITRRESEELDEVVNSLRIKALKLEEQYLLWRSKVVSTKNSLRGKNSIQKNFLIEAIIDAMDYCSPEDLVWITLPAEDKMPSRELEILENWWNLISLIEIEGRAKHFSYILDNLHKEKISKLSQLYDRYFETIYSKMSFLSTQELDEIKSISKNMLVFVDKVEKKNMPWWWRLINWITRGQLVKREGEKIFLKLNSLSISCAGLWIEELSTQKIRNISEDLLLILKIISLDQNIAEVEQNLQESHHSMEKIVQILPKESEVLLQNIVGIFDPVASNGLVGDIQLAYQAIAEIRTELKNIIQLSDDIERELVNIFVENQKRLASVKQFENSSIRESEDLWNFNKTKIPSEAVALLTLWGNFIHAWEMESFRRDTQALLEQLDNEDQILNHLYQHQERLYELSREFLRNAWLEQVSILPNAVIKETEEYITAIEELINNNSNNLSPENKKSSADIRRAVYSRFESAQQVFPIWATTNLSARNTFPLRSEIFDMLIIDEASQCDIASVAPLGYRCKQIVIIGDPKQLRHISNIQSKPHEEIALKNGIDIVSYNFRDKSLYDLAQRSVGTNPGVILLNEHYRSDERIISFSNQYYYNGELQIKTDLRRYYDNQEFIDKWKGIYWLDIPDSSVIRINESWRNPKEIEGAYSLVMKIRQRLQSWALDFKPSIGIVTPFREQADFLHKRLNSSSDIIVGTAHTFQGDEKDLIIFSTVITEDISSRALGWLKKMDNLINVAVTRPRLALFIVGNFSYCANISDPNHPFRILAEYVSKYGYVEKSIDALLERKEKFQIAGVRTHPSNTEYTRATLRRLLESCQNFIYWIDPYFTDQVFNLLLDLSQDDKWKIRDVKFITSLQQLQPSDKSNPSLTFDKYRIIKSKLEQKGISLELRFLELKELPHDRFLYSENYSINMPPFINAYGKHNRFSEYTLSNTEVSLFYELWQKSVIWKG